MPGVLFSFRKEYVFLIHQTSTSRKNFLKHQGLKSKLAAESLPGAKTVYKNNTPGAPRLSTGMVGYDHPAAVNIFPQQREVSANVACLIAFQVPASRNPHRFGPYPVKLFNIK